MALNSAEDAASVLEQFTHDIANIPAEITHLMEEIHAKDVIINTYKDEIYKRDAQLQKWVRANGGHTHNPKEEAFSKTINDYYDKCEILQAEKCGLAEKAKKVLDRHVKRFDVSLKGLMQTDAFPSDAMLPSLLTGSGAPTGVNTPVSGITGSAVSALPLQAVSGNIGSGGGPAIAHAAVARLAQNNVVGGARAAASGAQPPSNMPRAQREGSSDPSKRKRLNASVPIPASSLRQSSLQPGTPKGTTPVPPANASSRAGSAQPARPHVHKKAQPSAPNRKTAPPQSKKSGRASRPSAGTKKGDHRRRLARDRATPSTNASVSGSDDETASPTPSSVQQSQFDGSGDAQPDEEDDDEPYCYCKKVSFGDMVGCDNVNCSTEWFHYKCVGLTEPPVGEWLCPDCRKLPRSKIQITKE